jgi:hypothetical protein
MILLPDHGFSMHQGQIANMMAHDGMMALDKVKLHTCKNEPEATAILPG